MTFASVAMLSGKCRKDKNIRDLDVRRNILGIYLARSDCAQLAFWCADGFG